MGDTRTKRHDANQPASLPSEASLPMVFLVNTKGEVFDFYHWLAATKKQPGWFGPAKINWKKELAKQSNWLPPSTYSVIATDYVTPAKFSIPAAGLPVAGSSPSIITFREDFSKYLARASFGEGQPFGPWGVVHTGYGSVRVGKDQSGSYIEQSPKAASSSSKTHASLVVGPSFSVPLTFEAMVLTLEHLRAKDPNQWEVAWLIWDYRDNDHFYYVILKPEGWELGKRDPAYPGGQRFLATGSSPKFPINRWYKVKISQENNTIAVHVDGTLLVSYADMEKPYMDGGVGFYNEDARTRVGPVAASGVPAGSGLAHAWIGGPSKAGDKRGEKGREGEGL